MSEAYTKVNLVAELAKAANISRRRTDVLLNTLAEIAYREAKRENGFAVPGICRLDVVHRKARIVRNPQTNQTLLIAEHDALRVRAVKRARDCIAPPPRAMVHVVEKTEPAPAPSTADGTPASAVPVATASAASPLPSVSAPTVTPAMAPASSAAAPQAKAPFAVPASSLTAAVPAVLPRAEPATPPSAPATVAPSPAQSSSPAHAVPPPDEGQFISFRCTNCKQEIEAPIEMIGSPNECPTCGENLIVPYISEPGTIWYQDRTTSPERLPQPPTPSMKGRTIRIELPDDL